MANILDRLMVDPDLERATPWCSARANHDLERSILRVGVVLPLVADQNFVIIDGYRRWRVLKRHRIGDFRLILLHCDTPADRRLYREMLNGFRRS